MGRPSTGLKGQAVVEVYNSDPDYGDPQDFVFYLPEDGYTEQQLDMKMRMMKSAFLEAQEKRQRFCTSKMWFRGPYRWRDEGRVDYDPKHLGDDEFRLTAYFIRSKPIVWTLDEMDFWLHCSRQMGMGDRLLPTKWSEPLRGKGIATGTGNDPFADHYFNADDSESWDSLGRIEQLESGKRDSTR